MHTSDYTAFAPLLSARRVLPWLLHLLWRLSLRARLGRCCAPFAAALVVLAGTGLTSCRVTRHVPEGASVVSRVWLEEGDEQGGHRTWDARLRMAVVQKPYHRTFGLLPVSTWIWHNDTTQAFHRWRGRVGTAPAVYDEALTERSEAAMRRVLAQQGYLHARVTHSTLTRRRKTEVTYHIDRGEAHRVTALTCEVEDDSLRRLVLGAVAGPGASIGVGQALDREALERERTRLTTLLRNHGYWDFNREDVRFVADTMPGLAEVELTMMVEGRHRRYRFGRVRFVTDYDLTARGGQAAGEVHCRPMAGAEGYEVQYRGERPYLREGTLLEACYVRPGAPYTERALGETYEALCRLGLLRYVNLRVEPRRRAVPSDSIAAPPAEAEEEVGVLDCDIYLTPRRAHTVQLEVDGTNTAGDLGFALGLTYLHRNALRGSETLTTTVRGGYESLSGNLAGLVNDSYTEYAAEASLDIPKFLFPTRTRSRATTAVSAGYSLQRRPEYTRIITQGSFSYKWLTASQRRRHRWDVFNLSYVYLPRQSDAFLDIVQHLGPLSYSSYQSHMIASMSYSYTLTGGAGHSQTRSLRPGPGHAWALRLSPELAGNLLQGLARATHFGREEGRYVIFSQPFEQYARFDADWSYSRYLTDRSRLALHLAGGVAVPYGNSSVMPFEKRYYAGGANSVRGWSVRQLGPGRYQGARGGALDYFNQCGDVRFDASAELRSRLVWNFEFAAFVDAGNIWTLRSYSSQPGGALTADFYRQLAAAWGIGLRLVTDFVVLRLDLGLKAYDPAASGREAWRIRQPLSGHNRTLHFAVGYPF